MTKLYIDYKAGADRNCEWYCVDRNIYPTVEDVMELARDCMGNEVYLVRAFEGDQELFTFRNHR